MRTAHGQLDGYFRSPQDDPPKWLAMLYAYLDETGQEGGDWVFIAGFLGTEEQWKDLAERWSEALGSQRKFLHMTDLRWGKDSTRQLLARLGPIPYDCGLRHVVSGVNVSHYRDLIAGSDIEQTAKGYSACLIPTTWAILSVVPENERVELVFERQDRFEPFTNKWLSEVAESELDWTKTSDSRSKLAKWSFVPKNSTLLLQPADYLAYALTQHYRDKKSKRAQWCHSITVGDLTDDGKDYLSLGKVFSRNEIRDFFIEQEKLTVKDHGGWGWGLNVPPERLIDKRRLLLMTNTNNPENVEAGSQPVRVGTIPTTRSNQYTKIYANSVNLEVQLWDIRLVFGEATKDSGTMAVENHVEIVMSPQHAKALAGALVNILQQYENNFGEIHLPAAPGPVRPETEK